MGDGIWHFQSDGLMGSRDPEKPTAEVFAETYSRAEICDPNGYRIELRQWFRFR